MPSAVPSTGDSYQILAAYLRENPQAARQSPEEIAEHLVVPIEIVRAVFSSVDAPEPAQAKRDRSVPVKKALVAVNSRFENMMKRPVAFLAVTALIGVIIMLIGWRFLPSGAESLFFREAFAASVAIGVMLLHYVCFFHTGKGRVVFAGAGIVWVLSVLSFVLPIAFTVGEQLSSSSKARSALLLSVAFLILAGMYMAVGLVLSVLGGYARAVRADREEARLTRQQLLQRLFQVEERLKSGASTPSKMRLFEHPTVLTLRQNPYLAAFALGLTLSLLRSLMLEFADVRLLNAQIGDPKLIYIGGMGLMSILGLGLAGLIAFVSGKLRTALLVMACYLLASNLITLIPLGPYGPSFVLARQRADWVSSLGLPLIIGIAAGMGARVEARAANERRLQANDPAVLVAEMVEIQRRLNPDSSMTHVLFVDVAGSTDMKTGEDALNVEFSFREFQNLVSSVCQRFGGRIHGTAGDGAAAEFKSAEAAFGAANSLQEEMDPFNAQVSRLAKPFRVRVGLHSGTVAGDLSEVEFASVIDIAAHVQDAAPVGGIALTSATAKLLSDAQLIPMRYAVDGEEVFLAITAEHV